MITDSQLYTLSIFLGSAAMLLITLYHFLEVNAQDDEQLLTELSDEKSGVGAVKSGPASVDAGVQQQGDGGGSRPHQRTGSVKS